MSIYIYKSAKSLFLSRPVTWARRLLHWWGLQGFVPKFLSSSWRIILRSCAEHQRCFLEMRTGLFIPKFLKPRHRGKLRNCSKFLYFFPESISNLEHFVCVSQSYSLFSKTLKHKRDLYVYTGFKNTWMGAPFTHLGRAPLGLWTCACKGRKHNQAEGITGKVKESRELGQNNLQK